MCAGEQRCMLMVSVPHHWDEVAARALLADGGCSDSQTLVESLTWLREHPAAEVCCFGGARGCGRGSEMPCLGDAMAWGVHLVGAILADVLGDRPLQVFPAGTEVCATL